MMNTTVCILSYNRPAYLREAVASVLAQTSRPEKIVIFDNGSEAGVQEAVADYLEQGVQWVGADANQGAMWNFERAIQSIDTQYYVLLHDDDRLDASFLERQVKFMNENQKVSVVSCNGYFIDERGRRTGETLAAQSAHGFYEMYDCSGQVAFKYASNSCVPLSPALYRTDLSRGVSFRPEFGKVMDAVYFCDLTEAGPVACLMDPLYESRLHGGQDSNIFSAEVSNKLEGFFETRKLHDESQRVALLRLLIRQHTARNLKLIYSSFKRRDFSFVWRLIAEKKFSTSSAIGLIGHWAMRILRTRKLNAINRTVR